MSLRDVYLTITGRKIAMYGDFIDPFCYIGFHSLRQVAERRGLELGWRGFELNPATPPEGLPLVTAENSDLRPGMWASVQNLAKQAGLDFPEPQWVPNTRLAHYLVEVAKIYHVTNPLIDRIYQAYFRGHQDISQKEILIDLASTFKIPKERIIQAWENPDITRLLEQHRAEAQQHQFLGIPGFRYKGKNHFGALSQAAWEKILSD
jgi:predicted DsbA family dithiol-disulfide isomerase